MTILLTNDDGINSEGIIALNETLEKLEHINTIVIAPERERSASSHSITIFEPLILKEIKNNVYTLNGTPADCVKIALNGFLKNKIDLVISGINSGPNMGFDVFYSGTVGAAREACFNKIPAIALSINSYSHNKYFNCACHYSVNIINNIIKTKFPENIFLNINFPNIEKNKVKGLKITCCGNRIYNDTPIERENPFGWKYFWVGGDLPSYIPKKESDFNAIENNYISITPLQIDQTAYSFINNIKSWKL